MKEDFKPGDVVRLNSGSPKMTVNVVDSKGIAVVWFDVDHSGDHGGPPLRANFGPDLLAVSAA